MTALPAGDAYATVNELAHLLPNASLMVLAWWLAIGSMLAGLGAIVQRAVGTAPETPRAWLESFWTGFAVALFALQIWHLFAPVEERALAALGLGGAAGLLLSARGAWRAVGLVLRRHRSTLVALALVAAWLANLALVGPRNGDSGMYHVPTMQWLEQYAVVPGLGNLHSRLAFNQSYFLYVALLDVAAFSHRGTNLANGLLALGLFAAVLGSARGLLRRGTAWSPGDLFFVLFLPAAVELSLGINLTSPSPDFAVFVLGAVLSGQLLRFLERPVGDPRAGAGLVTIALLAAAGVTVKLSFAMLGFGVVAVATWRWLGGLRTGGAGVSRVLAGFTAIVALGLLPWMGRGVVLSGYPLFPSTFGAFPVDWRVPVEAAQAEADFIRVWTCSPLQGLRDPAWLKVFLDSAGWSGADLVVPMTIAGVAAAALLPAMWLRRRRGLAARAPLVLLLPTLAALVFWFLMAPRPRFAGAALWLLAVDLAVLAVERAFPPERRLGPILAGVAALAGAAAYLHTSTAVVSGLNHFGANSRPHLTTVTVASGLVVNVPDYDMCRDAPLPCSPFVNPGLTLRRTGDLASGFRIDPSVGPPGDENLIDPAVRLQRPR